MPVIDTSWGYGPTYWEPMENDDGTTDMVEHRHPWWLVYCMRHGRSDQVPLQEQAEISAENPEWFCGGCAFDDALHRVRLQETGTYLGEEAAHENALQRQQEEREREAERRG